MTTPGYDIRNILEEAQVRWLKPGEVFFILQNFDEKQLTDAAPQKPPSGSLFLFDRKVLRFFRKDGHSWRRKKDGKALGEAHERLKVGNVEALNCYYAHGEQNPSFQRRSYWMLNSTMEHIVLVHYRDTTMGRNMTGPLSAFSPGSSSNLVQSSNSYASQLTTSNETGEPYESSYSPSCIEVSSDSNTKGTTEGINGSPNSEVDQALRRIEEQLSLDDDQLIDIDASYDSGLKFDEQSYMFLEDFKFPTNTPARNTYGSDPDYLKMFDQEHIGTESCLTIEQDQKFTIREISPEWGYANESTKVFFIGSFTYGSWTCMFGDIKVPVKIIQEGVICCEAPPCLPGKVTVSFTSNNQDSHSEIIEFEYREKPNINGHKTTEKKSDKSLEELLLLVRLVQMLQSDQVEDSWGQLIEALLDGTLESSNAIDWILEQLLKDKLHQWLSSRLNDNNALSKREQGMIHMISGLGFCWALSPILNSGVSINFRDINGWTALHWAARFGREKMVAELLACGAFAGAITDPSKQDPTGKTPASIASACGHKGLAGYLSEMALTGHLSSLKLQETELSRSSADVEAERTVNNIVVNDDHVCLKDTLSAVRNATQAAARIQSAFRAHSFRRRQQREYGSEDEYGILESDIEGLSKGSKLAFRNVNDNHAALSIQKKYRGWKGRKDFVSLRQKVVKIQAHVRGHQVRKSYKVICWAVGMVEKIILRWRRKGAGLRGFRQVESIDEGEDENEDVVKAFRREKVDVAIGEAVSRVLSMVDSQPARQQYHRMLENHRQAKAEHGGF
ncbi:hypothetical protein L2E82_42179 [Cichorium intybus]|uniref:Uncharacterized protein n=1 Tax=Cichorium intybus TaxID=13427 RepID=A0ACB8ZLN9_CICIN|nr:hypothetical protein L2E82_42179 [Cichorium intybus]